MEPTAETAAEQALHHRSGNYIPWLDGARFLAASLVFFSHYKPNVPDLLWLFSEWHIGVSVFFVLSGIVIRLGYPPKEMQTAPQVKRFWLRRAVKLYALHTLFLLLQLPRLDVHGVWGFLVNLLLLQGWFPDLKFTGIPQAWSLSCELFFYIGYGLCCLAGSKGRNWRWGFLALVLLFWLWAACRAVFWGDVFWMVYTPLGRVAEFVAGVLVAEAVVKAALPGSARQAGGGASRYAGPTPRLASWTTALSFPTLPLLLTFLLAPALLRLFVPFPLPKPDFTGLLTPLGSIAGALLGGATIGIGFYASIRNEGRSWLASRAIRSLGLSAYAFYLLHLGPLASAIQLTTHNQVITYIICWVFSFAIYSFAERPLLQSLYRRIKII